MDEELEIDFNQDLFLMGPDELDSSLESCLKANGLVFENNQIVEGE